MLDVTAFSFLNRAMEMPNAPILIMATNRGITQIRGTDYKSPHGIPIDFLDRCLIIPTFPYSDTDMKNILTQRSDEEDLKISREALELLVQLAKTTSLRYGLQLLSMSELSRKKRKGDDISMPDVQRVFNLFFDVKRSTQYLLEYSDQFLFSEYHKSPEGQMGTEEDSNK
eukprot:Trichotokara_eunicae@DN3205_c0_g1_i3.p1